MSQNKIKNYLSICLILMWIVSPGISQDVWNLQRCIGHALEHNLDMQQTRIAVDQADIAQKEAHQRRYPSLNGSTNVSLNFGRSIDPTNNTFITRSFLSNNIALNSSVTLFNSGRISNSIKQANINKQSAQYTENQTERDISLLVANAYLNVLFAEENIKNTQNQLALTREQYNQIQTLINAGVRPQNEILDIEAQIALGEQNVITQENGYTLAILNLKQLLLLDPSYDMVLDRPEDVEILSDADLIAFNEIYNSALNNQSGIKAAELDMQSAIIGEQIAKSALYPSISLGATVGSNYSNQAMTIDGGETVINDQEIFFNGTPAVIGIPSFNPNFIDIPYVNQMDQNLSYGVGVSVQIPIYNNYQVKAGIERSKLNTLNSAIQKQRQENQLKINVQQALADAKAASKSYTAAKKSRDAQKAAFDNAQTRYDLGSINSFDYVNARNLLDNAQVNLIISKYDFLFKSKVVDFYMGRPITLQ